MLAESDVFAVVGEENLRRLVAAFYRRVPTDAILGAMYPQDDLPAAEARLASFLIYRFGGPANYLAERGHPRLRMRHGPFRIDKTARDRWIALMDEALAEVTIDDAAVPILRSFFEATATFMINAAE